MSKSTINSIKNRKNLSLTLKEYKITKNEVIQVSKVSPATVFRFFNGKSNSKKVQSAIESLIAKKVEEYNLQSTKATQVYIDITSTDLI